MEPLTSSTSSTSSSSRRSVRLLALTLTTLSAGPAAAFAPSSSTLHRRAAAGAGARHHQPPTVLRSTTVEPDTSSAGTSGVDKVNAASRNFGGPLSGVTDGLSGVAFAALHAFDDCGVQDAAKNLRVLWTRALLSNNGVLNDDVAYDLLPESTRGIVGEGAAGLWEGLLPFCDWIRARTEYLDGVLDTFLDARQEGEEAYQVVLMGAGYDTRSLRKQGPHVNFFEVDLPEIVEGKGRLYGKYVKEHPDRSKLPTMLGMDLDEAKVPGTLLGRLYDQGLKRDVPTMFVFEAVLFYLEPDATQGIFGDIEAHSKGLGLPSDSDESSSSSSSSGGGSSTTEGGVETVVAFTDSLKGLDISKPFMPDVRPVFEKRGFQLLTHRAQWGGAVHFTSMVSGPIDPAASETTYLDALKNKKSENDDQEAASSSSSSSAAFAGADASVILGGPVKKHMVGHFDRPLNSYAPQFTLNSGKLMREPSFRKSWYAVGFSSDVPYAPTDESEDAVDEEEDGARTSEWQIFGMGNKKKKQPKHKQQPEWHTDVKKPSNQVGKGSTYATRLWGEPIVMFRDKQGEVVCLRDVCPHRAAPLSMGTVNEKGELACFYHGWSFGKDGECTDVPTMAINDEIEKESKKMSAMENGGSASAAAEECKTKTVNPRTSLCATHYAVAEHNGMVWVWGGDVLEADPRLLPTAREGEKTLYVDTALDYNVDWAYIVENNLDSPHIYWLHDGSIPPLESLGFNRDNVDKFGLRKFRDEIGVGHVGKTESKSTTKIVRFDAPNIVRHCGVSGFSEEFHIVPIAPHRTRVLLRQHFPKGPILEQVASNDFLMRGFADLMHWWNYNIALEDYSVMQGQAHNIEDLGYPNVNRAGLGDDLINEFYNWRKRAFAAEGNPYFKKWGGKQPAAAAAPRQQTEGAAAATAATAAGGGGAGSATVAAVASSRGGGGGGGVGVGREWMEGGTAERREGLGESLLSYPSHVIRDDGHIGSELGGFEANPTGTWGLKKSYIQETPAPTQPPVNARGFRNKLALLTLGERGMETASHPAVATAAIAYLAFFGLAGEEAVEARAATTAVGEALGSFFGL